MSNNEHGIAQEYIAALGEYLAGVGEPALVRAYELGRKAVAEHLSILEMVMIHQQMLARLMQEMRTPDEIAQKTIAAANFLAESLSPFEMQQRGFLETHAALEKSESRFRAVAETAHDAIVTADSRGNIVSINPAAEQMFDYKASEVLRQPLTLLMPARFQEGHTRGLARYLATGEAHVIGKTVELAGLRKDGTEFPLELSLATWKSGDEDFFTAIIRDITRRKEAEEGLKRYADELVVLNKELEAFSYSISHDLRQPLRAIAGFAKILATDYDRQLDAEGKHCLDRIQHGVHKMSDLLEDVLRLSRVGRAELVRQRVILAALVEEVRTDLAMETMERQIEWRIAKLSDVEADPILLKQVFVNLLANAIKFTRSTPHAIIEVGEIGQNGLRVIYVRDNGVGFDMQYSNKLFGVFQRLHRAEDFEGTGVGLAIVHRIIGKHGGRIWAESAPGEGATFFFTLSGGSHDHGSPHQAEAKGGHV